jgi:small-conductance mechanosensitive channel
MPTPTWNDPALASARGEVAILTRMDDFSALMAQTIFGNTLRDWGIASMAFLATFMILPIIKSFVTTRLRSLAAHKSASSLELTKLLVGRTTRLFMWTTALWLAERFLDLPPRVEQFSKVIIVVVAWIQVGVWGSAAVRFALERKSARSQLTDAGWSGSLDIILFVARAAIFAIVLLLALDNLGINITALVAGLGIGGIAIALAVQTILGDLLASLSIAMDKPFVTGDLLRIDDCEGRVEHIGIKSTRLRSVTGEQIILANADVLKSRVRNLGRMTERRVLIQFSIDYEATPAALEQLPSLVEAAVRAEQGVRFEFCFLKGFGESGLQFEACYFFVDPLPRSAPAMQDAINRRVLVAFADAGLRFAHPIRQLVTRPA